MRFLKENLFLIVTCAAVVVFGGLLLVLGRSFGSQADEFARLRTDESRNMKTLQSGKINAKVVQAVGRDVNLMKDSARGVAEYCLNRNRADYQIITFEVSGKKVKAFPIDRDLYRKESLRWFFPREYRKALLAVLNSLRPTRPPTPGEIREEAERIAQREAPLGEKGLIPPGWGRQRLQPAPRPEATPPTMLGPRYGPEQRYSLGAGATPRPPTTPRVGPTYRPAKTSWVGPTPRPRATLWTRTPTPGAATTQPAGAEDMLPAGPTPQEKAERNLIWAKSQEGWIYADELSLYAQLVATGTSGDYADDDLWMAQVGLWIQKDITEAINQTNQQAQKNALVDNAKGVPSSAVKRLVGTRIRGYVLRSGAGSSPGAGSPGARLAGAGLAGASSAGTEGGIVYLALAGGSAGPPTLTGRACNKLYDVVHYDFTVIIPAAYLRRLYENLRLQNFHTVIDVVISVPGMETETGRGAATARSQGDSYCYYGTGPVVRATIVGELLLLTEWTRGRWDAKKKTWDKDYPPLVPEQFLARINRDPEALREEDKTRIGRALVAPRVGPMPRLGPRPGPTQYPVQGNIRYEH